MAKRGPYQSSGLIQPLRAIIFLTISMSNLCGCDAGRFGTQNVRISVTERATGKAINGGEIHCAPTAYWLRRSLACSEQPALRSLPLTSQAVTDEFGTAIISFPIATVRGGILVWLAPGNIKLDDEVTGSVFLCSTRDWSNHISVTMITGSESHGERHAIRVLAIEEPIPSKKR